MKIGVISDTHGNIEGCRAAVRRLVERGAHLIIHLGDGAEDAIEIGKSDGVPIECIAGNNDCHPVAAVERCFSFDGQRIFAVHGHEQDMNRYHDDESRLKSLDDLAHQAAAHDAGMVLFGHTHLAQDFAHSGIRFINPGSLDLGVSEKSCCIINLDQGTPTVEFIRF